MDIETQLGRLSRTVLIEAIYIAGQHLTHQRSSAGPGSSENAALTDAEAAEAREVARKLLALIESKRDPAVQATPPTERVGAMEELHAYLRDHVNHAPSIRRQADAELDKIRERAVPM